MNIFKDNKRQRWLQSFLEWKIKWNSYYSCKHDSWSLIKAKWLLVKQTFHELNNGRNICPSCYLKSEIFIVSHTWIQSISMHHWILKSILDLRFQFLRDLEMGHHNYQWLKTNVKFNVINDAVNGTLEHIICKKTERGIFKKDMTHYA